jgi:hypothetical protein
MLLYLKLCHDTSTCLQVYPVKPEAFLAAILDPQTGENVDLQMNFEGLQAAVDLRQVSMGPCIVVRMPIAIHGALASSPWHLGCCSICGVGQPNLECSSYLASPSGHACRPGLK